MLTEISQSSKCLQITSFVQATVQNLKTWGQDLEALATINDKVKQQILYQGKMTKSTKSEQAKMLHF